MFTVKILICIAVLTMLVASTLGTAARAGELAGATLPDTMSAGDKTLKLNGLGLRKKTVVNVYVGGLYLESPSKDAGKILAADQAKAIRLHFLRNLTTAQLVEGFQEGFEENAKDKAVQKAAFDKMLALIPYLTDLDAFILISSVLVLLTLIEVIVTTTLSSNEREDLARRIDHHCRWIFPIAYAVVTAATLLR